MRTSNRPIIKQANCKDDYDNERYLLGKYIPKQEKKNSWYVCILFVYTESEYDYIIWKWLFLNKKYSLYILVAIII